MHSLYETLVRIVDNETFLKAAEVMHLTQPTVTRHIQQLEAQVGVKLFDRIGKRLVLNHAGELVYQYAKRYLALEQKMQDELNAFADPEEGTVYIGAGLTPSIYLLPQPLAAYRRMHPRVQFQVRTGSSREICAALLQREVEMGVVTTVEPDRTDLESRPLYRDDLLVVGQPNHPLAKLARVPFQALTQYPFILMHEGSGLRKMVVELTRECRDSIVIAMETDSLESINRLVQHGVGISILPRSSVQDDIVAGRLAVVSLDVELPARTITLVTRINSILPASAAQFATALPRLIECGHGTIPND